MKIKLIFFAVFLMLLSSTLALSQKEFYENQTTTVQCNGLESTIKVSLEDLQNAPSWNPETDDAPLSTKKAVEISRKTLQKCVIDDKDWILWKVELTQLAEGKWFYEVQFERDSPDDCRVCANNSFVVYVKMDGTIAEPKPRPKVKTETNPNSETF
jgi:hypothetical protein